MLRELLKFTLFGFLLTISVGWSLALWAEKPVLHAREGEEGPTWPGTPRAGWQDRPRVAMGGAVVGYAMEAAHTTRRVPDEDAPLGFYFGIEHRLERHEAGLPLRAFVWHRWIDKDERGTDDLLELPLMLRGLERTRNRGLPIGVQPLPFVVNVTAWSLAGWTAFGLPGAIIRSRRALEGRCVSCGYPRGDGGVCTECGVMAEGR